MVEWLELHLSNQRVNKNVTALLRKLPKIKDQNNPELAEGLEGTWRREQIAAIVRETYVTTGFERYRLLTGQSLLVFLFR